VLVEALVTDLEIVKGRNREVRIFFEFDKSDNTFGFIAKGARQQCNLIEGSNGQWSASPTGIASDLPTPPPKSLDTLRDDFDGLGAMDARAIEKLIYQQSGLLGVSGISSDMRTLLESREPRAQLAVDLFVYRIGASPLAGGGAGGLDALVLTGGIGERAVAIRERVCRDAGWLGIYLDPAANKAGGPRISTAASRVPAWVLPTNEELMIARHTRRLMAGLSPRTASDVEASPALSEKV
jgi:hypothetical protein